MDLKNRSRESNCRGHSVAAIATLALCAAWSTSAHSRTPTDADCGKAARDLKSLDVPAESLALTQVDHVPIPSASITLTKPDAESVAGEKATPLLDLTPRAESALRDIFDADRKSDARPMPPAVSSSPIAETEELPDVSELPDNVAPVAPLNQEIELPLLQRRMYRTDI